MHKGQSKNYVEAMEATGRVTNFRCTNGKIVDTRWEGGLTHLDIELSKMLEVNETIDRVFKCDFFDTFIDPENSWEEKEYYGTEDLTIIVRFPKGRPPLTWKAYGKQGPDIVEDMYKQVTIESVKNKPSLVFKPKSKKALSSCVIRWTW